MPPHGDSLDTAPEDLELVRELEEAIAAHPLALLAYASHMVAAAEPDDAPPHLREDDEDGPTLDELTSSFRAVGLRPTDALLLATIPYQDDVTGARIPREVKTRGHDLPDWLWQLDEIQPVRAALSTHILGDGENIVLGIRLADRSELSLVIYVDHNMGTVVKDAFAVEDGLDVVLAGMDVVDADGEVVTTELPLADARARLEQAIERGRITYPPFETDTWPGIRPFTEWMVRLLPEGGIGYERPEVSDDERDSLVADFLASKQAALLARLMPDTDVRGIAETIVWFGADYGPGDPLRWSPVSVEIFLIDWVPRKIVADDDHLQAFPAALRTFVRFAHRERSIPPALTRETLGAIDDWEEEYLDLISRPRRTGPEALLERMGVLPPLDADDEDDID